MFFLWCMDDRGSLLLGLWWWWLQMVIQHRFLNKYLHYVSKNHITDAYHGHNNFLYDQYVVTIWTSSINKKFLKTMSDEMSPICYSCYQYQWSSIHYILQARFSCNSIQATRGQNDKANSSKEVWIEEGDNILLLHIFTSSNSDRHSENVISCY